MSELKLHDYQIRAYHTIRKHKAVYLMLDMGMGKTPIALKVAADVPRPTIVFSTPRVINDVWPVEIEKWQPQLKYTVVHGKDKHIRITLKRDIYLLSFDAIKWFYKQCIEKNFAWSQKHILVLDESSYVKNHSSVRFNLLQKMDTLFGPYRMCLSGTPAGNGLHELWSQYYILDKGECLGRKVSHFHKKYFIYTGPPRYKYLPKSGTEAAIYDAVAPKTVRLDAADYNELPEVKYNAIRLSLPEKARERYEKIEDEGKGEDVDELNYTAMVNNLRQFVQGGLYVNGGPQYELVHKVKLDVLKEIVDTAAGQPVMCAIHYKFELAMIQDHFKQMLPCIVGKTTQQQASSFIRRWNKGDIPLLIVHPQSVGHGVNLQAGGHIIVWYNLPWSLELYHQLNARLIRQGQTAKTVVLHHLIMEKTIDEAVLGVLANKQATQTNLFDAIKAYMEDGDGVVNHDRN